jgi:XTP/dITP diphosphohydrolase
LGNEFMTMAPLILATRNVHKVQEIRVILGDTFRYMTLNDFPEAPAVVEDAGTFAGNATKKAADLARWLIGIPHSAFRIPHSKAFVLADDSGLQVDALGGAPGVHSARFAALEDGGAVGATGNSPDAANNARLLRLLREVPLERRTARFRCVLALVEVNREGSIVGPLLFEGACEGRISFAPSGKGGFGYDPLFVPAGQQQSFAELGEEVKNQLSHRAKALARLREYLRATPPIPSPPVPPPRRTGAG